MLPIGSVGIGTTSTVPADHKRRRHAFSSREAGEAHKHCPPDGDSGYVTLECPSVGRSIRCGC